MFRRIGQLIIGKIYTKRTHKSGLQKGHLQADSEMIVGPKQVSWLCPYRVSSVPYLEFHPFFDNLDKSLKHLENLNPLQIAWTADIVLHGDVKFLGSTASNAV